MYPIGNVSYRHFALRPVWEKGLKDAPAHLAVQTADPVDRPASPQGEVGHIEVFSCVIWVTAAQGQQFLHRDIESVARISAEILSDEGRCKTVKACSNRCMGGEEVACTGNLQCNFKRLACLLHERPGALQYGKGCMPFIQVA